MEKKKRKINPLDSKAALRKAIRAYCVDCSGGSSKEVEFCPIKDCKLWPYRFGVSIERAKAKGKIQEKEVIYSGKKK